MKNSNYEILNLNPVYPIGISLRKIDSIPWHFHKSIELLMILEGTVAIYIGENIHQLVQEDVFLVNSNVPHSLFAQECVMIVVQIDLFALDQSIPELSQMVFECNSSQFEDKTPFDEIKRILALLLKADYTDDTKRHIIIKSLTYQLLYELLHSFHPDQPDQQAENSEKQGQRIVQILEYIYQHFREPITLTQIAANAYISPPYLSKLFERKMNMTPLYYINMLRLNYSMSDLLYTKKSIETIAEESGFTSPRSYTAVFRKQYNMTPSQYRNLNSHSATSHSQNKQAGFDYLDVEQHQYLAGLAKYLPKNITYTRNQLPIRIDAPIYVDALAKGTYLRHTCLEFISVGRAKEILFAPIQEMLCTIQREIGFHYIKFHGILSDDMMVYDIGKTGASYCFTYVDMVIDFLLSIGLKPLIQLSFMPKALAKTPTRQRFYSPVILGEPNDWDAWEKLVKQLTLHFLERYGAIEVREWLFSPWNEPDTGLAMYGFEKPEQFYALHLRSFRAVKSCDPKLKFGGASMQPLFHTDNNYGRKYFNWCKEHNCRPDFFNLNFYDLEFNHLSENDIWLEIADAKVRLSTNPNSMKIFIDKLKRKIKQDHYENIPIYLTEWNSTACHSDLVNDTCFKSAYIVKNVLENFDELDSFGYWMLSDLHEEYRINQELFHGGLGLFTYNGIKKPGYYAYWFLSKLGTECISKGDGYFITRSDCGYQLLLYYYVHFSDIYAIGESFDLTFKDRYTPFTENRKKQFSVQFSGIENGTYHICERWVNRDSGSCFDQWVYMGAQKMNCEEEINALKAASVPKCKVWELLICDGVLNFNTILEPLEIRLVKFERSTGLF